MANPGFHVPHPQYLLRVLQGPDTGRTFRLRNTRIAVGRGRADRVDLPLSDVYVAPRQFDLIWNEDRSAYDLLVHPHPNPTTLNGREIRDTEMIVLRPGDEIGIGDTVLVFEGEEVTCHEGAHQESALPHYQPIRDGLSEH